MSGFFWGEGEDAKVEIDDDYFFFVSAVCLLMGFLFLARWCFHLKATYVFSFMFG